MRKPSTSSRLMSSRRRRRSRGRSRSPRSAACTTSSARHQDGALDRVVELAHVARPGVIEQRLRARRHRSRRGACGSAARGAARKCAASSGMSSRRSRSGGTRISIVFRRKSRSSPEAPRGDLGAAGPRWSPRGSARPRAASATSRRARTRPSRARAAAWPAARAARWRSRRGRACRRRPARSVPTRSARASVKAPCTWPNSSLSKTPSESPPAFTVTIGAPARGERACSAARDDPLAGAVLVP